MTRHPFQLKLQTKFGFLLNLLILFLTTLFGGVVKLTSSLFFSATFLTRYTLFNSRRCFPTPSLHLPHLPWSLQLICWQHSSFPALFLLEAHRHSCYKSAVSLTVIALYSCLPCFILLLYGLKKSHMLVCNKSHAGILKSL